MVLNSSLVSWIVLDEVANEVTVSSLCWTCCAIMRLMLMRFSVMSLDVWAKHSFVIFRCLTAPSGPSRSSCFSILSMESLLARLAFLQDVWLLSICFLCPSTWVRIVCLFDSLSCSIAICSKSWILNLRLWKFFFTSAFSSVSLLWGPVHRLMSCSNALKIDLWWKVFEPKKLVMTWSSNLRSSWIVADRNRVILMTCAIKEVNKEQKRNLDSKCLKKSKLISQTAKA